MQSGASTANISVAPLPFGPKEKCRSEFDGGMETGICYDQDTPDNAEPRELNYWVPADGAGNRAERADLPLRNHAGDCVDHDGWTADYNTRCKSVWSQPIVEHPCGRRPN